MYFAHLFFGFLPGGMISFSGLHFRFFYIQVLHERVCTMVEHPQPVRSLRKQQWLLRLYGSKGRHPNSTPKAILPPGVPEEACFSRAARSEEAEYLNPPSPPKIKTGFKNRMESAHRTNTVLLAGRTVYPGNKIFPAKHGRWRRGRYYSLVCMAKHDHQ